MILLITLLGALVLLIGILPLIEMAGFLPGVLEIIPREGMFYNIIIAVLGGLIIYFSVKKFKRKKVVKE